MPAGHPTRTRAAWQDYRQAGAFDEAITADGRPREHYARVLDALAGTDLEALAGAVAGRLEETGVVFGGDAPRRFAVDPVPRLLTAAEWRTLEQGLAQRVRALDRLVADVHGDREILAAGVLPPDLLDGCPFVEDDLRGLVPPGGARIGIAGLDLLRDADGGFVVLEDNVRTPSGMAYALAACDAVGAALPDSLERPARGVGATLAEWLPRVLEAASPGLDGELVLLSDGEDNSAWFEHRRLAALADLELVTARELRPAGDRLELRDGRRVRAVYRRTDCDRLRDDRGEPTELARLLLRPLRAGELGIVNGFGTGVADDKRVYAHVDEIIRFYLGEEPLLRSVRTYDLADGRARCQALARLAELVVKPRGGHGGSGVVVGPTATAGRLKEVCARILAEPAGWIAQETVRFSTHPTVAAGRLEPRHVDLRPFVLYDGEEVRVLPGGLTRVALQEGSLVVNSSRQGGGKDTWVLP